MKEQVANSNSKALVVEATGALARLDADRLEEIAERCHSLGRGASDGVLQLAFSESEWEGFRCEIAVFARVLEATSVNLNVLRRVSEVRSSLIEYGSEAERNRTVAESGYGDN